jgi:hypothetical protein
MSTKRRFRNSWHDLGNSVRAFINDADAGAAQAHWPDLDLDDHEGILSARLAEPVVLHGWPPRAGSKKSLKLVIAIEARVSVVADEPSELHSYGTKVSYFCIRPDNLRKLCRLDSFHYDMDTRGLCGHPVFHAQPYSGIDAARMRAVEMFKDFEIDDANTEHGSIQNIRIPTAQLDLISVFAMLIADHFLHAADAEIDDAFTNFIKKSSIMKSPLMARTDPSIERFLHRVMDGGADVRSCHWYPYND